jgi:hypothetical protein
MDVNSAAALDAKNMYCLTGTLKVVEQGLGGVFKFLGVKKAGVVSYTEQDTSEVQSWITSSMAREGVALSATTVVPDIDTAPGPAIATVVTSGATGVVLGFGAAGLAPAIQYTVNTYPGVKMVLPSYSYNGSFVSGIPISDLVGLGVAAWQQPITAMQVPGVKEYWDQYGHTVSASSGFRYYDNSILAWLGTKFILNVANTVHGSFSHSSLLAALHSANNINMYGIMPPYTSADRGKNGAVACSPYNADVVETTHLVSGSGQSTPIQVAAHPGVFNNPVTGKVAYVDPGFKA